MYIAAASAAVAAGAVKLILSRQNKLVVENSKKRHSTKLKLAQGQWKSDLDASLARAERLRDRLSKQLSSREQEIKADEESIAFDREAIDRRAAGVSERDDALAERFAALKARQAEAAELRDEITRLESAYMEELQRAAGLPRTSALDELKSTLVGDAQVAAQKAALAHEELISDKCHTEARRLMEMAMTRYGTALPANRLIATVSLPTKQSVADAILADNSAVLHAIHQASEVEFVDQGEGNYYLQAPDPFTREVGRLAFERMVKTGKISDGIAKTAVDKARADLDKIARMPGEGQLGF